MRQLKGILYLGVALLLFLCARLVGKLCSHGTEVMLRGNGGAHTQNEWFMIVATLVFLVVLSSVIYLPVPVLSRWGKRGLASTGQKLLKNATWPPILFLRSFEDDERFFVGPRNFILTWRGRRVKKDMSLEEAIALYMRKFGPVVAIGKPDEWAPALGAARVYFGDDWQDKVRDLILRSQYVAVFLGNGQGLQWEIDQLTGLDQLHKVIVIIPPVPIDELQRRWSVFTNMASHINNTSFPRQLPHSAVFVTFETFNGDKRCFVHESSGVRNAQRVSCVCADHYEFPLKKLLSNFGKVVA